MNSEGDPTNEVECDLVDTELFNVMIEDAEKLNVGGVCFFIFRFFFFCFFLCCLLFLCLTFVTFLSSHLPTRC